MNRVLTSDRLSARRGIAPVMEFFALTALLTAPIWAISAALGLQILPGLPIGAIAVVCPAAAALIVASRRGGRAGGWALLKRTVVGGRISLAWWLAILLICPAVSVAAFLALRLGGSPVPDPQISLGAALILSAMFLVAGLSEELGWSGLALDPLQARWGAFGAALVLGGVWAVWHYPTLLQAHRSPAWIAWWTLGTVTLRIVMVWLYNGANRSVFAVAAFHAVSNLCWQLFPIQGSWFDPRLHALLMSGVAGAVIFGWLRRSQRQGQVAQPPPP